MALLPPSAASKCLDNLCVLDTIIEYIDGKSILHLAMTCRRVWGQLARSRVPWRRALSNHPDLVMFPGAHLRAPRTLVVLHFSSECVMCGVQTSNPILGNHAIRLCNDCSAQNLVAKRTYTTWQNGPRPGIEFVFLPDAHRMHPTSSTTQYHPAEPVQIMPANLGNYVTFQREPVEREAVDRVSTASPREFYNDSYLNPNYSSREDINRDCGFPVDLDDEDFQGMHIPNLNLTDNHGPSTTVCANHATRAGSSAGSAGFTTVSMARVYHPGPAGESSLEWGDRHVF